LSGYTQIFNATLVHGQPQEWHKVPSMKIPRKGHSCVSITTDDGERLMAVGGFDIDGKSIVKVELFNPYEQKWTIDDKRTLPYETDR
jgi:hypothetical protein